MGIQCPPFSSTNRIAAISHLTAIYHNLLLHRVIIQPDMTLEFRASTLRHIWKS
jgi:hypothetical protein